MKKIELKIFTWNWSTTWYVWVHTVRRLLCRLLRHRWLWYRMLWLTVKKIKKQSERIHLINDWMLSELIWAALMLFTYWNWYPLDSLAHVRSTREFYACYSIERLDVAICQVLWNLYFETNLQVHGIGTFASDMEMSCTGPSYFGTSMAQNRMDQGSYMEDELHKTVMSAAVADLAIQTMAFGRCLVSVWSVLYLHFCHL